MQIEHTDLPGVLVLTPRRFGDARGWFAESWNRRTLAEAGLDLPEFVQDNHSLSTTVGTVRGLHYQAPPHAQGKLVRCARGALWDVAVDARAGSPTYGAWTGETLTAGNGRQLWIPPGFLHGFLTLEDDTEVAYKCTAPYVPEADGAVLWSSCGIDWPIDRLGGRPPILSDKDAAAPPFGTFETPFSSAG